MSLSPEQLPPGWAAQTAPLQQAGPQEQEGEGLQSRVQRYLLSVITNKSEAICANTQIKHLFHE